jgi:hypothetical protein
MLAAPALALLFLAGPLVEGAAVEATVSGECAAQAAKPRMRIRGPRPDHIALWWWAGAGAAGLVGLGGLTGAGIAAAVGAGAPDPTVPLLTAAGLGFVGAAAVATSATILIGAPWSAPGCEWLEGKYNFPGSCAPCVQPPRGPCPCAPGPPACRDVFSGDLREPDDVAP